MATFRKASKFPVRYWQYFNADILTLTMQPTAPLEKAAGKAYSENLKFSFLENNTVQ